MPGTVESPPPPDQTDRRSTEEIEFATFNALPSRTADSSPLQNPPPGNAGALPDEHVNAEQAHEEEASEDRPENAEQSRSATPDASPAKRPANSDFLLPDIKRTPSSLARADIDETLSCAICRDILYQPVSLECLHTYCGGCWSTWNKRSRRCPTCRKTTANVKPNFIVRAMVDAWLRLHPDKKRSDEDILQLEADNEVPRTGTAVVARPYNSDEESEDSADHSSDTGSHYESSDDDVPIPPGCRHCPPATATDGFQCPAHAAHLTCSACGRSFPDRPEVADSRCHSCSVVLCDYYFTQTDGSGCGSLGNPTFKAIKPLAQFTFDTLPAQALQGNTYEQEVLRNALNPNRTVQDIFATGLSAIRDGTYTASARLFDFPQGSPQVTDTTAVTCGRCAQAVMANMCYWFRENLVPGTLPDDVRDRPNCWYGRECRTQRHNRLHAERLNHICDNTRRAS